jgi:glycosyltransferase involved in cell wall biosynthesis
MIFSKRKKPTMGKTNRRLKGTVSVLSNSPGQPTGYGQATDALVKLLKRDGANVAALSNYGHEGINTIYKTKWGEIPIYARGNESYSNDVAPAHHKHWKALNDKQPDLMITLYDVWVLNSPHFDSINMASWTPIDHNPIPPGVLKWLQKDNVTPLAMSKFGLEQINKAGLEGYYIPHSIDTKVFKYTETIEGQSVKEFMGFQDDRFIVGMNAANKATGILHRKAFGENMMAFAIFCRKHPEAMLYIHADATSQHGWNLMALGQILGIPADNMTFPDPLAYRYGMSQEALAGIYSSWDVMLATSYGEGFGVPTVEAQAVGVPVIVSNFTASPELVGDGWAVNGQPLYDPAQHSFWTIPSVPEIAEALEQAYANGKVKSAKAVEFAQQFDHEKVWQENWLPVLDKLLK